MIDGNSRAPRNALILLGPLLLLLLATSLPGQELKIFGSEHPPYSYLDNGKPAGLCTDIIRALLKAVQHEQEIIIAPWARSYKTALEEPNVLLFTVARTPEREALFHWVGVIVSGATHLYALKERESITITNLADAQAYKVGVVRDDIRATFLRQNGIINLDEVADSEANAKKLAMGWIDLWVEEENTAPFIFKKLGYDPAEKLKKVYTLDLHLDGYLAFSRKSDPELVTAFRIALERLKNSGDYRRILATYDTLPNP